MVSTSYSRVSAGGIRLAGSGGARDGDLEFDSKELDDLKISFTDIAEFHSPKPNRYVFEGREVIVGPAAMQGDTITIHAAVRQSFPRKQLIVILEGEVRELSNCIIEVIRTVIGWRSRPW